MIRFVSVDLETTGLDPKQDQILEVAAVTDDGETLHRIVHWDRVSGHPKAMLMNARLMEAVMDPTRSLSLADVISDLRKWLERWSGRSPAKVTGAGKNFASFDLQFLLAAGSAGRPSDIAPWIPPPGSRSPKTRCFPTWRPVRSGRGSWILRILKGVGSTRRTRMRRR